MADEQFPTGDDREETAKQTEAAPTAAAGFSGERRSALGYPHPPHPARVKASSPSPSHRSAAFGPHEDVTAENAGASARSAERLGEIRTDLAIEAAQARPGAIPGLEVEERRLGPVTINRVRITTPAAEQAVGKRMGSYVTLEAPELRRRSGELQERLARLLAEETGRLLDLRDDTTILVVGLGNWNATPDALGPRVVANLLITRHLREQVPDDLRGGLRSVAALAPGVLGLTGIETSEIIHAVVDRIRPDVVLAVDSLASRSIDRILTTVQVADTGINPGSGVGNDRGGLSRETLGVPVVALGVPTVVHATTIAHDTLERLVERLGREPRYRGLESLRGEEQRQLIEQVLSPSVGDLMVTPKEIDILIEDMSKVLAAGINAALHPRVASQAVLV